MRLYLEYILSSRRPSKVAVRRQLRTGFTITEVLASSLITLVFMMIAGNGMVNLLRNSYKANADSDIRNSLNRSLEFIRQDIKRAGQIVTSPDRVNKENLPAGATPILAFYMADPNDPTRLNGNQVIYFVDTSNKDNPWSKSPTLFRYGPPFDSEGNTRDLEDTGKWQMSVVATDLDPLNPLSELEDCDPLQTFEAPGVKGCPKKNGQVKLGLAIATELTTQKADGSPEKAEYAQTTAVSTNSTGGSFFITSSDESVSSTPTPSTPPVDIEKKGSTVKIITNQKVDVTVETLRNDKSCELDCYYITPVDGKDITYKITDGPVTLPAYTEIKISAGSMVSSYGTDRNQIVNVYTKNNPPPSSIFTRSLSPYEVIVSLVNNRASKKGETYQFFINIEPSK